MNEQKLHGLRCHIYIIISVVGTVDGHGYNGQQNALFVMLVGHANRLEMIIILKANFHQICQICYAYNLLKYLDFQIW